MSSQISVQVSSRYDTLTKIFCMDTNNSPLHFPQHLSIPNTISRSDLYTMLRKSLGRSKVGAYSGRGAAEHTEFPHSLMTKSQNMYRVHPYSTPRNLLLPGLTFMGCKGKSTQDYGAKCPL